MEECGGTDQNVLTAQMEEHTNIGKKEIETKDENMICLGLLVLLGNSNKRYSENWLNYTLVSL